MTKTRKIVLPIDCLLPKRVRNLMISFAVLLFPHCALHWDKSTLELLIIMMIIFL